MPHLGISEAERACYVLGETATSRQEARASIRRCLTQLRHQSAPAKTTSPNTTTPSKVPSASATEPSTAWQRYSTCLLRRQEVSAAEGRRLRALAPWMVAAARLDPASEDYQSARRSYETAVAELERLLPASLRGNDPLIPAAVQKFMTCDPKAF